MILDVQGLAIAFERQDGSLRQAVHGLDLTLAAGQTLGIVGESGSGKSATALALIGLLPPSARIEGRILFEGRDLLALSEPDWCALRGRHIGMIFQEPMTALNPAMRIGAQIAEGLVLHRGLDRKAAKAEALRLLDRVRIPDAARRVDGFPHEMSGGQRQRVGIAIALACRPDLLIADEPTSALDVTVQADILDILDELVGELGLALILISHDLGVIGRIADRTLVMYRGHAVEQGPTEQVLRRPENDYTRKLLAALPRRVRAGITAAEEP
ncbi:MAG: ABC transporter ATP-binding protein [Rhodospirillaceae bacterium]|nr:ABC transporter ATP-binding protein [Rhodospirillaceae bacterium]